MKMIKKFISILLLFFCIILIIPKDQYSNLSLGKRLMRIPRFISYKGRFNKDKYGT